MNITLRRRLITEFIVALFFFTTISILRVGDRDVRTANAISDDHPVVWAKYAKNPELWMGDPIRLAGPFFINASVQNWLASFLYRKFSFSPELFTDFLVWLQNVGLGLALLFYCRYLNPRPVLYWAAAVATFVARPWQINLAYFPDVMYVPYPAHLVLSFLVLGLLAFLSDNRRLFLASLIPAALVHPLQTLHLLMILVPTLFFDPKRNVKWRPYLFMFSVVFACVILPQLFGGSRSNGERLSSAEYLASLLLNLHITSWKVPMISAWVLPTFIGFFFGAGTVVFGGNVEPLKALFKGCVVAVGAAVLLQLVGIVFGVPYILITVPLRCTVLISVFLLPILFSHGLRVVEAGNSAARFSAMLAILFQMYSGFGLFWGQWLIVLLPSRASARKIATLFAFGWVVAFVLLGRPFRDLGFESTGMAIRNWLAPAGGFDSLIFFFSVVAAVGVVVCTKRSKRGAFPFFAAVLVLAIAVQYREGTRTKSAPLLDSYVLQKWAKENTAPKSLFMSMTRNSWRGIAERPVVYVDVGPLNFVPYSPDRRLSDFNRTVGEMFHSFGSDLDLMNERAIVNLGSKLGADYFLRSTSALPLNLPEVFRNSAGAVYRIR